MTHDDRPTQQHPQPVKPQPTTWRDRAHFVKLRAPNGRTVQINKGEADFIAALVACGYEQVTP